jgi:hypothetical protein
MPYGMGWLVSDGDIWDTGINGMQDEMNCCLAPLIDEFVAHTVHNEAGNGFGAHF